LFVFWQYTEEEEDMSQSEVARLRRQIELEYEAANRVFIDFTPTARHDFITKRQENIEGYFQELKKFITPEEALNLIIQASSVTGDSHASL
jgi:hypothetical protein